MITTTINDCLSVVVPDLRHPDGGRGPETRAEPRGVCIRRPAALHRRRLPLPHHPLPLRQVQVDCSKGVKAGLPTVQLGGVLSRLSEPTVEAGLSTLQLGVVKVYHHCGSLF